MMTKKFKPKKCKWCGKPQHADRICPVQMEKARPYVEMRIAANVRGMGIAAAAVFEEEVDKVCRKLDPDQPN